MVSDAGKRDAARTSYGSWLNGHKRSETVGGGAVLRACPGLPTCDCALQLPHLLLRLLRPATPASAPPPPLQVRAIQHSIHALVGIPEAFGESLYVLQYDHGQKVGGRCHGPGAPPPPPPSPGARWVCSAL